MMPYREYMPLMPEWTPYIMYFFFVVSLGLFIYGFNHNLKKYGIDWKVYLGKLINYLRNEFRLRVNLIVTYVIGQKKVLRKKYAGIMHLCIYIGISVLSIGTLIIFLQEDVLKFMGIKFLAGSFYLLFEVFMDTAGLLLILGVIMALYRRLIIKPEYIESNMYDYIILILLLFMGLSGFVLEGARLSITDIPWSKFSYIGSALSVALSVFLSSQSIKSVYPLLWWSHAIIAFILIALVPYSKLFHIILIPSNLILTDIKPVGKLTTPFNLLQLMEAEEEIDIEVGVSKVDELNWNKKIEVDACVNCGRCQAACPAYAAGRELSPRTLIQTLKNQLQAKDSILIGDLISENAVWSCTNCYACVEECPTHINHVDLIIDFRRYLIGSGKLDEQKMMILSNLDRNGNPYGIPSYKRAEWLRELGAPTVEENPNFEYLYWIGCAGSIDPRVRNITKAMIKILNSAGINYAILGELEKCSGEVAKRIGEESRFQQIALENIEIFERYGVKKIITHCPHCFNVFKYEYPELGGNYKVIHHTQLIKQLIEEGRIKFKESLNEEISYHDPCNLGRINGIYTEPRDVLKATGAKIVEAQKTKSESLCCGGGGGNAFYSVPEEIKISQIRLKDFKSLNISTVAVACPFCMSMFEDAKKIEGLEDEIRIKDISEIVAKLI